MVTDQRSAQVDLGSSGELESPTLKIIEYKSYTISKREAVEVVCSGKVPFRHL